MAFVSGTHELYIGLMSGTSLDGVDAVLADIGDADCQPVSSHFLPYSEELRADLLALHSPGQNELERSALLANQLASLYAETVYQLLAKTNMCANQITAIGCHGQTIRHRPGLGFTLQIGNAALLAELTGIGVVADFRSRDIAAGGQGAPLVPAFHQALFWHHGINRAIINIGGIANISYLPSAGTVIGFDSGPGNMLMDAWAQRHLGKAFDESGGWAATGHCNAALLEQLLSLAFFDLPPPKSTGRDTFNLSWLSNYLQAGYLAEDVQATLLELTARTITQAVTQHCGAVDEVYICGGGAYNDVLTARLGELLLPVKMARTDALGMPVNWMEAAAFAWLARQTMHQATGNLPDVTGAKGKRILGAIYA